MVFSLIRLYNLDNSNDPNELFVLKEIPTYGKVAENIKPYVYTFSFYNSESISNPAMWVKYGQVALNFEIVNDPMAWDYFRISLIHYGESEFMAKYSNLLKEMHERYPAWHFEPDLESMLSLLAFHKEEAHSDEQEVRLLYVPFLFQDRGEASYDFRVSKIRTGMTKYIELPIQVADERKPIISRMKKHAARKDDSIPLIRITSIEFGDNQPLFDEQTLKKIKYELEDYLVAKFDIKSR